MIEWLRRAPARPPATAVRSVVVGARTVPLRIRTLKTARRMTLRLAPDGSEARITVPPWGSIAEAEAFARERSDWLARQLGALPAQSLLADGASLPFRGELLTIAWSPDHPRKPTLDDGAIVLGGAESAIEGRLRRWLEGEALRLFAEDAAAYAEMARLPVPPVKLTRARRRWGSCTRDGAVRLNWRLVMAPDFVRRSVVAHEIAHLVHFDHSPRFYRLLDELFEGDLPAANRWLKREGRTLYAVFA